MQNLLDKLVQYYANEGPVVLLESQGPLEHPAARYSYLAAKPEAMIKVYGRKIEIWKNGQKIRCYQANPWQALRDFRAEWNDWMIGYLGYDLKNKIELLESHNRDDVEAPDLFFYDTCCIVKSRP